MSEGHRATGPHDATGSLGQPDESPVPVLYIMGASRSGPTFLDTVLGNHPEIEGAGELRGLVARNWVHRKACACGEPGDLCPFWSEVRRQWASRTGSDDVAAYLQLQDVFERLRGVPGLAAGRWRSSPLFDDYARRSRGLFAAIRQVSQKPVIVDSSKAPGRLLALARVPGLALRVIHLVRDGRAVLRSLQRKVPTPEYAIVDESGRPPSAWHASLEWRLVNHVCEFVLGKAGVPWLRLRYEDFVSDPEANLAHIGDLLDLDLAPLGGPLLAGEPFDVGHGIAGNRIRLTGPVTFRPSLDWRGELSAADGLVFRLIARGLARRYGYE